MANLKTRALTRDEYYQIIETMKTGFIFHTGQIVRPNIRVATALVLQGNLGLRIGDVIKLRLDDIIHDGGRLRLNIREEKTGKKREFTVLPEIYQYIQSYALKSGIGPNQRLFSITVRAIQKHLKLVADHLGFDRVGTHSLRKFFSLEIYNQNNFNIELVRQLLQHSSVAVTQHYISVQPRQIEEALAKHISIPT